MVLPIFYSIVRNNEIFWPHKGKFKIVGPSGVRALPLAAGINVGGHSNWHYFSLLSLSLSQVPTFLPESVVVGFRNFALAPN